jgi:hypothetical protein
MSNKVAFSSKKLVPHFWPIFSEVGDFGTQEPARNSVNVHF